MLRKNFGCGNFSLNLEDEKISQKILQICYVTNLDFFNRPNDRVVTRLPSEQDVCETNVGPVEPNAVYPEARGYTIFSKGVVMPGRNDAEMGPEKAHDTRFGVLQPV